MSPDGGGEPSGSLAKAIADTFGGLDELKQAVNDAGVKRFGSGWSWLVWDGTGLAVYSTPNQDSPALKDWDDVPLLGIDVWEHAYYLKYKTAGPSTSAPGGTSSTGTRSSSASTPHAASEERSRSEGLPLGPARKDRISCGSSCCSPRGSTEQPARAGAPRAPAGRARASP